MKYLLFVSLFLVAAKGCGDKKVEGVTVADFGEEVTLAVGEALKIKGTDDQGFLFLSVEQESRCPTGVNCIQAGSATILVEQMNAAPKQVTIPANLERSRTKFSINGATVIIMALDPYPVDGQRTAPEDYELKVKLEASAANM